mmetsp:Transcript_94806/g.268392  ORF Transcript_94806/g.268392 Transcript_94806/m.268392 type:complete len:122 (-) Transcript_94806:295-660(-)
MVVVVAVAVVGVVAVMVTVVAVGVVAVVRVAVVADVTVVVSPGRSSQADEMLTWPKLSEAHAAQSDRIEPSVGAVTAAPSVLAILRPEQPPSTKRASPPPTSKTNWFELEEMCVVRTSPGT